MEKPVKGRVQVNVEKRKKRNLNETIYHNINNNNVAVYTPEFLQQNKLMEGDLRRLRKTINDIEEHNSVLTYYIDSLTSSCDQAREETRDLEDLRSKLAVELKKLNEAI